jgi:hypothetical protein
MTANPLTLDPNPPTGSLYCTDPECKSCKDLKELQQELPSAVEKGNKHLGTAIKPIS